MTKAGDETWRRWLGNLVGRGSRFESARDRWRRDEPQLRRRFVAAAEATGKPRGLRWSGVEWTGAVRFARETQSGLLTAFAGIVVRFEAADPDDADEFPAAGLPRDAVAVFHFGDGWGTGGRTLFNMTPDDALDRLHPQFEPVDGPA